MTIEDFKHSSLAYHATAPAGKLATLVTKPVETQRDLALAYTPGVAGPVAAIAEDPENAYLYTAKGNLVAVISNGTAILGMGNLGPLASKPVMEGKAVLFKRFANIDVFDIEIDATHPQDIIDTVARIAPTFGGINLEDIKAPECFEVEEALKARLDIPVFHDDQHGTAVTVAAGLLNALEVQGKQLKHAKIVCLGAGAAGLATMRLLLTLGADLNHIFVLDSQGVIHTERKDLNVYKQRFAHQTPHRTLADVMQDADVFIGVSGPNLLAPELLKTMAARPIVFALSNPDPEIRPEQALSIRQDLIMATGRSDYPNQVNNVVCFPYLFRGALDVRAHTINDAMLTAAVHAIASIAREPVPPAILAAYGLTALAFGAQYILPKPMDPRLLERVPAAVSAAAIASGVIRK